ncbi:MAG TPA: hypothetical protein VFI33_17945 [Puia sp.]|nr:hypothetical protein [Puia sp.]
MQTFRRNNVDISPVQFNAGFSQHPIPPVREKKLKIKEFISWAACFAVISGLTGLLKYLKVGITMDTITSSLFYLSLAGLIYFVTRIVMLSRSHVQVHPGNLHELN